MLSLNYKIELGLKGSLQVSKDTGYLQLGCAVVMLLQVPVEELVHCHSISPKTAVALYHYPECLRCVRRCILASQIPE